ncbi:hypothetical protein KL918_002415 [Ogataea parapolymorpha]|uniref:FAD dependent oxidoreductase domain-containing protein n=1 Tax=Ogataea parapolymorpha (strain ATCC 26012 / BCRC 20466 / JCM 22074 / NRRL Y-7560 / DL-1) TaxID=871575 RepID=W1QJE0_OGAPD|nr:hypothetical protein HPODL_05094 [Ogataea parapolymorpha DL-1]ESX02813.1 hypothetical protein HPODL_05094 [Ogataea parapolymorpha DL-1]KAG7867818.1 hypothetical protein KL918_002415 [Ogataea parapolymorpha]KAG7870741.1 hypothetical protein KL916_004789 [Ogataea parapolymorpha]
MKIVVVGAGVIGLTTALILKRKLNCDVVVVSKEIPGDADPIYTSTKAGAQWSSSPGNKRAEFSYRIFDELSKVPEAWVTKIPLYKGEIDPKRPATEPDLKSFVDNYEWIGEDQQKFPGVSHIYKFDTFTISPPQYLAYLANELLKLGVAIQRGVVRNFEDVAADYVINCTGIQYNNIDGCHDAALRPIRGHTLLIENTLPYQVMFKENNPVEEGEFLMLFPRKEGCAVLGGIYDAHSPAFDTSVHADYVERLQAKATKHLPELQGEIRVLKHNIGFRPHRDGGVRIEFDPENPKLIHNYGCSNLGFTESWACAQEVFDLIK